MFTILPGPNPLIVTRTVWIPKSNALWKKKMIIAIQINSKKL